MSNQMPENKDEELREQLKGIVPISVFNAITLNMDDLVQLILTREKELILTIAAERAKVSQLQTLLQSTQSNMKENKEK